MALEGVPGWAWTAQKTSWQDRLDRLKVFQQGKGRLPKQKEVDADGLTLGEWIHSQRSAYRKKLMPADRIAALEAIPGWAWKVNHRQGDKITFDQGLSALKAFVQAHGQMPPHREVGGEPLELHLGKWVSKCRSRTREGNMTPDQIAALEYVSGWWWERPKPASRASAAIAG